MHSKLPQYMQEDLVKMMSLEVEQPGIFAWFQTQANDFTEGQLESYKVQSIVECNTQFQTYVVMLMFDDQENMDAASRLTMQQWPEYTHWTKAISAIQRAQ
jgi:hypothetical protein